MVELIRNNNNKCLGEQTKKNYVFEVHAYAISKVVEKVFEILDNIVEEVEEYNLIQVVTNKPTNYKFIDQMLMTKRKIIF